MLLNTSAQRYGKITLWATVAICGIAAVAAVWYRHATVIDRPGFIDHASPGDLKAAGKDAPAIGAADTAFGLALLQNLAKKPGENVFISPFSVSQAQMLALNGAGGKTYDQIAAALHTPSIPLEKLNAANAILLSGLQAPDPKVTISVANALWIDHAYQFDPKYQQRCMDYYGAATESLDFSLPASTDHINGWVSDHTKGRIPELVSEGDVKGSVAILTNAVYFHGTWSVEFDASKTTDSQFWANELTAKPIKMMSNDNDYGYLHTDDFDAVRLPYGKGRIAMYVFLPSRKDGLDSLIGSITPSKWSDWIAQMHKRDTLVNLPRFTVSEKVDLTDPLTDLGMPIGPGADFSPMGLPGAYIHKVMHSTFLEVNEEGTTAAAATADIMTMSAREPLNIVVDHPFLCAIRDDQTGALLFVGAIRDPKTK